MHSFIARLTLCVCFALAQAQQGYYDPCHNKRCGDHGCCVRRDPYYARHSVFYRSAVCVCDEHYYYHKSDDVCRHGCYRNTCHSQYATCYAKGRGERYPGFENNNIYLDEYYSCRCNSGYRGNGRQCRKINPCENADCHQHATCHVKRIGSTEYHNYNTYKNYVQSAYFCRCKPNYYGNGRECFHFCSDHSCHQYATCIPKALGLGYPGSSINNIYNNNYYYCQCNRGYSGNGRRCSAIVRCPACADSKFARCIPKRCGSTSYPGYGNDRFYTPLCYYCECRRPTYYGNGRVCRRASG